MVDSLVEDTVDVGYEARVVDESRLWLPVLADQLRILFLCESEVECPNASAKLQTQKVKTGWLTYSCLADYSLS